MSTESKPNTDPSPGGVSPWLKSNLMGLGSAAVLAVYAAGFERTRAAAARFNDVEAVRRPAPPVRTTGEIGAPAPRSADVAPAPAPKSPRPLPTDSVAPARKSSPATQPAPVPAPAPAPIEKRAAEPTVVAAAPVTTPARDSAPVSVPAPVPAPAPAKPAEVAPPPKAAPAPAANDTAQALPRKDGTYTGWGTSRHGDIQATLQIKNGKIVFAAISECLTRYPCSWIAALPSQVLARQTADVDFVSGATESANAFYSAVVEALNKAK